MISLKKYTHDYLVSSCNILFIFLQRKDRRFYQKENLFNNKLSIQK